ncbi:hypothetical protein BJY00DRAFT_312079 [Aspergillus carlsbadensis]|nr:hypothetical protein BJY00DRAFT_312079 [Aspergillus carlsbadensis]
MILGISFALALLQFPLKAPGEDGDTCFLTGVKTSIVNDRLYFLGGNYLWKDNVTVPRSSLCPIELNSEFPVKMAISRSSLQTEPVEGDIAPRNTWRDPAVVHEGAIWTVNDPLYLLGSDSPSATSRIATYEAQTSEWDEVKVSGSKFNELREAPLYATAPEVDLGFILDGDRPLTWGMIRFNTSNLSWSNETLGSGSFGAQVPKLEGGALVYIPAGPQGM